MRISPVKPGGPASGSIRSLPLRDGVVLEFLSWRGDEYIAALKFPSGRVKLLAGKAGNLLPLPLPANSAPAPVTVCAWQWSEVESVFFSIDLH